MNRWLTSPVNAYIKEYGLTDKPIVYEVGSRDGRDGFELTQRIYKGHTIWKDSELVLFECNPPQINLIKQAYPQATLITEAISNKAGIVEFLQLHGDRNVVGSSSMNLERTKNHWAKDNSIIRVKTRRLDSVIKELGHEKTEIDIMKIDIEDYTWEALDSLGKYLRNVRVFHLETEIEGAARDKTNLDIAYFMHSNGYKCIALEHEWGPLIQDQTWLREDSDVPKK